MKEISPADTNRYPDVAIKGEDNTQADNAVADVFFFAPAPEGDEEIKIAKISISLPNGIRKCTMNFDFDIEVEYEEVEGKGGPKKRKYHNLSRGGTWVWDFGDA